MDLAEFEPLVRGHKRVRVRIQRTKRVWRDHDSAPHFPLQAWAQQRKQSLGGSVTQAKILLSSGALEPARISAPELDDGFEDSIADGPLKGSRPAQTPRPGRQATLGRTIPVSITGECQPEAESSNGP